MWGLNVSVPDHCLSFYFFSTSSHCAILPNMVKTFISSSASIGSNPRRRTHLQYELEDSEFVLGIFLKYNSRLFISHRRMDTISRPYKKTLMQSIKYAAKIAFI